MKFWQVDSFTDKPFKGNPAAVIILENQLSDALMQNIAIEMNLSETAFVLIRKNQDPILRWFTPMFEIDLCGHATLASAHIYLREIHPELSEVTFDTKSVGPLKVVKKETGDYVMDFPSRPGEKIEISAVPQFVLDALTKAKPSEAYQSRDLMLVYDDEKTIHEISPDYNALMQYKNFIIVTAKSSGKYDFISRFFCADDGIAEDPVTGSAHCTSAPYWAKKLGKPHLFAYQASKRGGELTLDVTKDRVYITGHAVTVINGEMKVS